MANGITFESDATYKLLISPTPMIGPDDLRKTDNHCDVGGFQYERDEFFRFLKANGFHKRNFFIVCGDRHWQYHAVDSTGIEEFSCAPWLTPTLGSPVCPAILPVLIRKG